VIAIALALLASLGWGLSDFFGGLTTRTYPLRAVVTGMMAGGVATAALMAVVTGAGYPGSGLLLAGLIAGLASMTAVSSLYKALAIGSMTIVSPISASYPVVPVIYGLLRGERPSALQLGGMVLVVGGVILASYVRQRAATATPNEKDTAGGTAEAAVAADAPLVIVPLPDVGEGVVERAREGHARGADRTAASILLAVVASLASGTVLVALSSAAETDPYWGLIVLRSVALIGMVVVVLAGRQGLGVRPSRWPLLLAIGAVDTTATGLFAVATTHGYLSVVSVIASLFPLYVIALARLRLGEHVQPHQGVGVGVALGGVALVALG
jgi:drug/metabolite transporter (DMT)-like permease